MKSICKHCGFVGHPKPMGALQVALLVILLLLLVIPGLIYMVFLALTSGACPSCGKRAMIRIDTPIESEPKIRTKADYDRWKTKRQMRETA